MPFERRLRKYEELCSKLVVVATGKATDLNHLNESCMHRPRAKPEKKRVFQESG